MHDALLQMTLLMLLGASWNYLAPITVSAAQARTVITTTIYNYFLPAMVLSVLWRAELGSDSFKFSIIGSLCITVGIMVSVIFTRLFRFEPAQAGAFILAASFPNVTYLGLPVLENIFGPLSRTVVMQIDFFAAAPMVFGPGIVIARAYGMAREGDVSSRWWDFFNTPPFWALIVAVLLNISGVEAWDWLIKLLEKMSASVAPMMIFSLGLALSTQGIHLKNIRYFIPIGIIKLLLMPWFALYLTGWLSLTTIYQVPTILDMAMPSMVLGIVFCDRYQLDSALYAATVTVTTLMSMGTLFLWHEWLT